MTGMIIVLACAVAGFIVGYISGHRERADAWSAGYRTGRAEALAELPESAPGTLDVVDELHGLRLEVDNLSMENERLAQTNVRLRRRMAHMVPDLDARVSARLLDEQPLTPIEDEIPSSRGR